MLKTKNQGIVFKFLFSTFTIIIIALVLVYRETIDLIYLGLLFVLIFKFLVGNYRK